MRRAIDRRAFLIGGAVVLMGAHAPPFVTRVLEFPRAGLRRGGLSSSSATLVLPVSASPPDKLVVLFHGKGESTDETLGRAAWLHPYGLSRAIERLADPPIVPLSRRPSWDPERLAAINASLVARPFGRVAFLCPFTPNLGADPGRAKAYASWVVEGAIPEALRTIAAHPGWSAVDVRALPLGIDGCSMGGPYAIDVAQRYPETFESIGMVQGAFGVHRAGALAEGLRAVASRARSPGVRVQLLTSTADPFRDAALALSRELTRLGVAHAHVVLTGPHDQAWLREAGTLEVVLFHEWAGRARGSSANAPTGPAR